MKKLIPFISVLFIVLLFLMSSRFVFFISYVKSQKIEFRRQLIRQNSNKTTDVEFSQDQIYRNREGFEWKEKNKELVIAGVYHEVISVKKTDTGYLVTVIEDKQENELFKSYFHLNKQAKKSLQDISFFFLSLNYIQNNNELVLIPVLKKTVYTSCNEEFYENSLLGKLLKPPGIHLIS